MQRVVEEQARDMEEMQSEFQNATGLMSDKFNNLNQKFLELQDLYEQRPSRPEDLDMMKDLDE